MTLYFEEEGDVKLPLECEALAKRVVEEDGRRRWIFQQQKNF